MKVARLTPHYYWPQLAKSGWPVKFDAIGGMQSQIYRLSSAIDELGVEQDVYTLKIPGAPQSWSPSPRLTIFGVRISVFPVVSKVRGMVDLNLSWTLGTVVKFLAWRRGASILHVHCSGVFWPPLLGLLLSKWTGLPLVLTIHCSILNTYHSMCLLDDILLPFARWCERRALNVAAHTIVLTESSRVKLSNACPEIAQRISVVPDCIDAAGFRAKIDASRVDELRRKLKIPAGAIVVGYVGRIAREKGWPALVEMLRKLPENYFLLVCGDGNERLDLEQALEQHRLISRASVTGYVSQEEIPNYYALLDAFVLPSAHEEFGGALLEAMVCEIPIVAYDVGGVRLVLNQGECGVLVQVGDVGELSKAVVRLTSDPAARERVLKGGLARVSNCYSVTSVARLVTKIYEKISSNVLKAAA